MTGACEMKLPCALFSHQDGVARLLKAPCSSGGEDVYVLTVWDQARTTLDGIGGADGDALNVSMAFTLEGIREFVSDIEVIL